MAQPQILLAYGERSFSKKLKEALEKGGSRVALLPDGDPPKARYDLIFQLARDPAHVAEGTRLLLDKAKKDRSRLLFVSWRMDANLYEEAARFAQTLLEEASRKGEAEIALLNLGRIYGPGVDPAESGSLGHLITEFAQGNILTLYGEGKDEDYYLFLEDALEGLILAPEHAQSGETYALAPSIPVTSKSAAELLLELGGRRHDIVFHRGLSASAEKGKIDGKSLPEFKIKTSFHDGILAILKEPPPVPTAHPTSARKWLRFHLPHPSRRGLRIAGIILLILSPLLYLAGEAGFSYYQLNRAKSAFSLLDFPRAQAASAAASSSLERLSKFFPAAQSLVEISQAAQEVGAPGTVLTQALENLIRSRRGEAVAPQGPQDFQAAQAAFSTVEQHLTLAWLETQQIGTGFLLKPARQLQEILAEGIKISRVVASFLGQAEELLGYKGERIYLIFFQNSTELRSTGGFLGSLAALTLQNGGIKSLQFFDSHQFASAGRVPPHPASTQLMGVAEVPLNETNIQPSFARAAQDAISLFEEDQKVVAEAAIGTTLDFAQDLLAVLGGFALPEFERQVTRENLFEVVTEEVEKEFFPGSSKKKRIMQALGEGLLQKVFSATKQEYHGLAKSIWNSLNERGLLVYFPRGAVAQALLDAKFDGRIAAAANDYLGVFDNNYSAKVNGVWVKRSIDYRIFSPDKRDVARAELTIKWEHAGTDSWPSNTYQNLLLTLAPAGSKFMGAKLNGEDYYSTAFFEQDGKQGFAAYFFVPHQKNTEFRLVYELPERFNFQDLKTYRLTVQKQPGTVGDPFTFRFEPTVGKQAFSPALKNEDGKAIFEGDLTTDLELEIEIKER